MSPTMSFSKSLLDAVDVGYIFDVNSKDAMTLEEWSEAKGIGRAGIEVRLNKLVESGILSETKKRNDNNRVVKAWGLKDVVEKVTK